jgi:hypothetical protein
VTSRDFQQGTNQTDERLSSDGDRSCARGEMFSCMEAGSTPASSRRLRNSRPRTHGQGTSTKVALEAKEKSGNSWSNPIFDLLERCQTTTFFLASIRCTVGNGTMTLF